MTNTGDISRGREVLQVYHTILVENYSYAGTLDALIDSISKPLKNAQLFLDNVGYNVRINEASDSQIQDAMENLAENYQLDVPPWMSFGKAIAQRISNPTATDYFFGAPEIIGGIAKDLAVGAQRTGNAVLDVFKSLEVIGPLLAVGVIVYLVIKKAKNVSV